MILNTDEKIACSTMVEVLNKYFDRNLGGWQHGFYPLDKERTIGVWFPQLSIIEGGIEKTQSLSNSWLNTLSDDGTEIHMYNKDGKEKDRGSALHITFAKFDKKSPYTFIGVFRRDIHRSTPEDNYLSLVSKTIDISPWANGVKFEKYDESLLFTDNHIDEDAIISEIEKEISLEGLSGESREAVVKVRSNQGIFRERLLQRYSKCCLCNVSNNNLLIASHIKPWSDSDGKEKLDVNNGFIMCPNHDKLFDQGWITFDDSGNILISNDLSETDKVFMNVREGMNVDVKHENVKYLKYHRDNIFRD